MVAYVKMLEERANIANARRQAHLDEEVRAATTAARERLIPLDHRLEKLLQTIPIELQREGLSLTSIQTCLRGRWRGTCHPGELGLALRRAGFRRERRWRGDASAFQAVWRKQG
jgi:hypothetical protein